MLNIFQKIKAFVSPRALAITSAISIAVMPFATKAQGILIATSTLTDTVTQTLGAFVAVFLTVGISVIITTFVIDVVRGAIRRIKRKVWATTQS